MVARMDRRRAELLAAGIDFRRHYYHPGEKIYNQCEAHKMKTFVQHLAGLLESGKPAVLNVSKLLEVRRSSRAKTAASTRSRRRCNGTRICRATPHSPSSSSASRTSTACSPRARSASS